MVEVANSFPRSPPNRFTYGPELTMIKGSNGHLALILMQHFISDTDLKMFKKESELELEEQIALGLFRVSIFLPLPILD